jgi:nicotinamide riboside kinase
MTDSIVRIGLLGGEATGKSTLADALARRLPGFVAEEYLRDFVHDFGRSPLLADQEGIYLTQQATVVTVERAAAHAGIPYVIADPLPLMTAVYSLVYFDDDTLLAEGLQDARTYDIIFWCAPDITWSPDPRLRDGQEWRERAHQIIADVIAPALPMVVIAGEREHRLATALSAIPPFSGLRPLA